MANEARNTATPGSDRPGDATGTSAATRATPKRRSLLSRMRAAFDRWWERNRFRVYIGGLLVLLFFAYFWPRMFITIHAGERGVMYRRFGGGVVLDRVWGEGLHVIPPWDVLAVYETRVQEKTFGFPTLTRDGLRIDLVVSVRYRPEMALLGHLHEDVGPRYYSRVIFPEIKSALRQTVGDRTAFEIYSTEGDVLQQALKEAKAFIEQKPIDLDQLVIEEIRLPPIVKQAIDQKHKQEQYLLEYEFRLQRAEREAERKRAEATGIRDYNAIIQQQGIDEDVLRWRGIEATLELSKSDNSKIIVIGGGRDKLPIILDASKDESGGGGDGATDADNKPDPDPDSLINEPAPPQP